MQNTLIQLHGVNHLSSPRNLMNLICTFLNECILYFKKKIVNNQCQCEQYFRFL